MALQSEMSLLSLDTWPADYLDCRTVATVSLISKICTQKINKNSYFHAADNFEENRFWLFQISNREKRMNRVRLKAPIYTSFKSSWFGPSTFALESGSITDPKSWSQQISWFTVAADYIQFSLFIQSWDLGKFADSPFQKRSKNSIWLLLVLGG